MAPRARKKRKKVVTGNAVGEVVVRRSEDLRRRGAWQVGKGAGALAAREDGRLLAAGLWDSTVQLLAPKAPEPRAVLRVHTAAVSALAFAADQTLFSAGRDGRIAAWDFYK